MFIIQDRVRSNMDNPALADSVVQRSRLVRFETCDLKTLIGAHQSLNRPGFATAGEQARQFLPAVIVASSSIFEWSRWQERRLRTHHGLTGRALKATGVVVVVHAVSEYRNGQGW